MRDINEVGVGAAKGGTPVKLKSKFVKK